jgi:hypothetical protein
MQGRINVAYVSLDYFKNSKAPQDKWVGVSDSVFFSGGLDDYKENSYYGECVTYVKAVTPDLTLTQTKNWDGKTLVKGNKDIVAGTAIATFNGGAYTGHENHAAIYVSQDEKGIYVWDQWWDRKNKPPKNVKAIGLHLIRFGGSKPVNDGDDFYIIQLK